MMKTCTNACDCYCCIYNFILMFLFLLWNFSRNSALSRNHGVFKQYRDLTEATYEKMHWVAIFPQRQYKLSVAGWLHKNLSTMYTKICCLFNNLLLFGIRNYGWRIIGSCLCVCIPYNGGSLTQITGWETFSTL